MSSQLMSLLNEETEILNRTTYFPHEHIGNYTSIEEKQVKNFIKKNKNRKLTHATRFRSDSGSLSSLAILPVRTSNITTPKL